MNFNKLKQQLESFLNPSLCKRIQYRQNGYRYQPDKSVQCYMVVDQKEIFNSKDQATSVNWYKTEQEILSDPDFIINVTTEDIESVRSSMGGSVPEERLRVIAQDRKTKHCAKEILKAQAELFKSDFQKTALIYLSSPIETSLESNDILLNVFALVDRRVGNKRLMAMKEKMNTKHPVVRYFYELRREKIQKN